MGCHETCLQYMYTTVGTPHHDIIPYLANAPHDLQPYHGTVFSGCLPSSPLSWWGGCVQGLEEASGDYSWCGHG